jgi:hypothetical protein
MSKNTIPVGTRVRIKTRYSDNEYCRIPKFTEGTVVPTESYTERLNETTVGNFLCTVQFDNGVVDSVYQWRLQIKKRCK